MAVVRIDGGRFLDDGFALGHFGLALLFERSLQHVQQHVDQARRAAGVAQAGLLRDKLRLVQEVEDAVASAAAFDTDWEARWTALPALDAEMERVLRTRFDAALAALLGSPEAKAAYARELEDNRVTLLHDLLRLEIGAGIDSGPEFARERLKLQVEVLQSSLKSGHGARGAQDGVAARLRDLCALPAFVDARTASRIEQLALRLAREGK
jgi:hypothetical protein